MDNCIPEKACEPGHIVEAQIVPSAYRPTASYDDLAYDIKHLRKKNADRKKALQTLNRKMNELQLMLSNQQWKTRMWEERCNRRDNLINNLTYDLYKATSKPWYVFWK